MKCGIFVTEEDRQLLKRILTSCIVLNRLTELELGQYRSILQAVDIAAPSLPVRLDENIGSCEPGPDVRPPQWDKTGNVWHVDVDGFGRYSVRRPAKRMPYQAYINGQDLGLMPDSDPEVLKRSINRRIAEAQRIKTLHQTGVGAVCERCGIIKTEGHMCGSCGENV